MIDFRFMYCLPVAKLCLTLCDPMDCSPPSSSVHGISEARILEWVAISSCRGSFWPRDRTHVSCGFCIGRFFTTKPPKNGGMTIITVIWVFKLCYKGRKALKTAGLILEYTVRGYAICHSPDSSVQQCSSLGTGSQTNPSRSLSSSWLLFLHLLLA